MKRIIVIDDDAEMRNLITDVLKRQGYDVSAFESANIVLGNAQSKVLGPTDAVICDVVMPDLDGRDFVKQFKHIRPAIPVILITAYGSALSPRDAVTVGASRLVMKPFTISELLDAIQTVTN